MKASLITLVLVSTGAFAVDIVPPPTSLPEAMVTVRARDEAGGALRGAKVTAVFDRMIPFKPLESVSVSGEVDSIGERSLRGCTAGQRVGGVVEAAGYYPSKFASPLLTKSENGTWSPWNPLITVLLKKIENPISMYAKRVNTDIPLSGEPVGYDLSFGDWVAPHGSGKISDLVFKLQRRFKDARDYESTLMVNFSSAGDGIQAWEQGTEYQSALKLPRVAPENGYDQRLNLSNKRLPGMEVERDVKEDRNYLFRVRTVLDPQGKVVSALYGKVDGDIRFSPIRSKTCSLMFTYYLNPTVNDRNLEFDVQRNLLSNLKDVENVSAP